MIKSGFVTILGRPNVGKSSFLNIFLNYDVAITSDKPQTTRETIKGMYNDDDSQIIFLDTPGIHKPKQKLGHVLNAHSYNSLIDIDQVIFLSPINDKIGPGDLQIIAKIPNNLLKIALITKCDQKHDSELLKAKIIKLQELGFKDIFLFSIFKSSTLKIVKAFIKKNLPHNNLFYDQELITDNSMRFMAKEVIRESALKYVFDEIPHALAIIIEEFKEANDEESEQHFISAIIYVARNSQKGILIGKKGHQIKQIGIDARKKLVKLFDHRVHLELKVKVNKKWTNDLKKIRSMGY